MCTDGCRNKPPKKLFKKIKQTISDYLLNETKTKEVEIDVSEYTNEYEDMNTLCMVLPDLGRIWSFVNSSLLSYTAGLIQQRSLH